MVRQWLPWLWACGHPERHQKAENCVHLELVMLRIFTLSFTLGQVQDLPESEGLLGSFNADHNGAIA